MSPANTDRASIAALSALPALAFERLNCFKILLATRFRMCVKHHIQFAAPGNFSKSTESLLIMVSFGEALSQVMLSN